MEKDEFISFLMRCFKLLAKHVDGSIHFICMDWRHASEVLEASTGTYTELKNIRARVKTMAAWVCSIAASMNSCSSSREEMPHIGIIFNLENSGGTGTTSGNIQARTRLAANPMKGIWQLCIQPLSQCGWLLMPCWIALLGVT